MGPAPCCPPASPLLAAPCWPHLLLRSLRSSSGACTVYAQPWRLQNAAASSALWKLSVAPEPTWAWVSPLLLHPINGLIHLA